MALGHLGGQPTKEAELGIDLREDAHTQLGIFVEKHGVLYQAFLA